MGIPSLSKTKGSTRGSTTLEWEKVFRGSNNFDLQYTTFGNNLRSPLVWVLDLLFVGKQMVYGGLY